MQLDLRESLANRAQRADMIVVSMRDEEMIQLQPMPLDQFEDGPRLETGVEQRGVPGCLIPNQIAVHAVAVAARMRTGEPLGIGDLELAAGDVLVSVEAVAGWSAAEEAGYVVLVDTRVTPALASEGFARELVRHLQELRREAGLEVTDRIRVTWRGDDAVGRVLAEHGPTIAEEVLALSLDAGDGGAPTPAGATTEADIDGHTVTLAVRKA